MGDADSPGPLAQERDALLLKCHRLEKALKRYGQHDMGCSLSRAAFKAEIPPDAECSCGFEAAAPAKPEPEDGG